MQTAKHLMHPTNRWGNVIEIDWHTIKLVDLFRVRLKVKVKENVAILLILETLEGTWVFTTIVVVVGE